MRHLSASLESIQHELRRRGGYETASLIEARRFKHAEDVRRGKRVTLYAFYVDLGLTIDDAKVLVDQAT